MPFITKCDFCGKSHRCRDTSHGKSITCKQCEVAFVALDPEQQETSPVDAVQLPPRKRKAKFNRPPTSESFDTGQSETNDSNPTDRSKKLMLIFGACGAACLTVTFLKLVFLPAALAKILPACGCFLMFLAHHQFCRFRIHSEIDSFGGQVDSIRWLPFQGALFSRGWHVNNIYTFFNVRYRERDGRKKDGMCGVSWIFGTRWDWD